MTDRGPGKVSYAVLSFGGFMGIENGRYPLPLVVLETQQRPERVSGQITHEKSKSATSLLRSV